MATIPGGIFDTPTVSQDHGAQISSFLDQLGISESSITTVSPTIGGTTTILDTTPTVTMQMSSGQSTTVQLSGTTGKTVILTGNGSASVVGGSGSDSILGGEGSDTVVGGSGNDLLYGGAGDDIIRGGSGNDTVFGVEILPSIGEPHARDKAAMASQGSDTVPGSTRSDTVPAGADTDTLDGGVGRDKVLFAGARSEYQVETESDDDFVVVNGRLIVTDTTTGEKAIISNAEYVEFEGGGVIVNESNREDASLARMTQGFFGEQVSSAELTSLNEEVDSSSLKDVAARLLTEADMLDPEKISDGDFIDQMYQKVLGRDADAPGKAWYEQALADGSKSRADILADFGWSDEAVDTYSGDVNTFDDWV